MDAFSILEDRVARLIEAYRTLKTRATALEKENAALREAASGADVAALQQRITALEGERNEVRARLERLLARIDGLEV